MLLHIKNYFDSLFIRVTSKFNVVFIISTADYSIGLQVFSSTALKPNKYMKNWQIVAAYETSGIQDTTTFGKKL